MEDDTKVPYRIEGTFTFEDLEVFRADATPQPLADFVADGRRYWEALHGGDERLSVEALRTAPAGEHRASLEFCRSESEAILRLIRHPSHHVVLVT